MDISNRSIALLLVVTLLLVAGAAALTFGPPIGTSPPAPVAKEMDLHLKPEVVRRGGRKVAGEGPLTVQVERHTSYETALLECDMYKSERPLDSGRVVFPTIPFGECSILLVGTEIPYAPVYPGDRLTCVGVDGQTQCTGGVAARRAAQVSVRAALPGRLDVDGDPYGALPLENLRMKVGERNLVVRLDDGRTLRWKLVVQPEETIDLYFPDPDNLSDAQTRAAAAAPSAP